MMTESNQDMPEQQELLFGEDFLEDHAGRLLHSPEIALVELVANAWDAGATRVQVTWPLERGQEIAVEDDGTGMTGDEFRHYWNHINYNRRNHDRAMAEFPLDVPRRSRTAYGCNGKGRHSMLCFNNEYRVETWRDGQANVFRVRRSSGQRPWEVSDERAFEKLGHGTRVYTTAEDRSKPVTEIRELVGSKFIADPEFDVLVNGESIGFEEITSDLPREKVDVPQYGEVEIVRIQAEKGRTSKQHGLAWWVNRRLVGNPGWATLGDHLLDGRKTVAKSNTFIVLANILEPREDIAADWNGFIPNERTNGVHQAVADFVRASIQDELKGERKTRKRDILKRNRQTIQKLSPVSQRVITSFIDEVQLRCPTLKDQDLENAATLLVNLEKSRSGYAMIDRLSQLQPGDLDGWKQIMEEWTLDGARKVLGELKWRLQLIQELEARVEEHSTDELHELQPLFEKGLWIFGPEYEAIEFQSNRAMSTIIKSFFGDAVIENPRIRPDFVALPEASLGAYSCNSYDDNGEVSGYAKVAIVELKRGGFRITADEMNQAGKYAYEIMNSGKVHDGTQILCFVLGAELGKNAQRERREGNIRIMPRPYSVVLRQAHARTFNLLKKMSEIPSVGLEDEDLRSVLVTPEQLDMVEIVG